MQIQGLTPTMSPGNPKRDISLYEMAHPFLGSQSSKRLQPPQLTMQNYSLSTKHPEKLYGCAQWRKSLRSSAGFQLQIKRLSSTKITHHALGRCSLDLLRPIAPNTSAHISLPFLKIWLTKATLRFRRSSQKIILLTCLQKPYRLISTRS